MKQKLYFLLLVSWIYFQSNGQTLDQSNWVTSTGTNFAIDQTNQGILGQSFTANLAGTLNQVKIDLNVLSAGTTVDFSIYEGSGNNGNLLGTLPLTFAAPSYGEYTIDVSSFNISATQGSVYTLVLGNASDLLSWIYTSGDTYTNGDAYLSTGGGSLNMVGNTDLRFKTYVNPTVAPVPASNINFDGVNDYIVLPNQNDFNFSGNAFTLEFWFKLADTNFSQTQTFISKGNAWGVSLSTNGKIVFNVNGPSIASNTNITDTNWHHCAVVFNNSDFKLFIDGLLDKNQYFGGTNLGSNAIAVAIGENLESTNRIFNGNLEDVRIWNLGRTNSQIQGAMNCELIGNETGLFAYYKFNNGNDGLNNTEILVLNDDSVNNYNGTFVNFSLNGSTSNFRSNSIITSGITIPAAPVAQTQIECLLTGADLTPAPSATVKWYYEPFYNSIVNATDELFDGTFYYSVVNANGCESDRTPVQITIFAAPIVDNPIAYEINTVASPLTAISGGTGLLWYTSSTGGVGSTTAPTPDTSSLGSTYYWVSSTNNNGCESGRSLIEVIITPTPPANDECSGGIALNVGNSSTSNTVNVDLGGATDSSSAPSPDCGGYEGGDVWFTTIVPASGNLTVETIGIDASDNWDTVIELYNGDCNNLSYIDCADQGTEGDFSKLSLTGLTPNETIYIRVWEYNTPYSSATFLITAYDIPPPGNDDCDGGIALTVGTSRSSNAINVDLGGATDSSSAPSPDCASYQGGDVWYTAVVPASGNLIIEAFGINDIDTGLEVYSGDCNTLNYIDCDDDGGDDTYSKLTLSGRTPNETIYIRIWEYSTEISTAMFQISAYELIPPVNDNCEGGIALTVGTSQTSNAVIVDLEGATDSSSAPYPDCGGYSGGDVWFTTIVPTSGNLTVETFGLNTNDNWDTVIELYNGDCNNLSYIDCADQGTDGDFSKLSLTGLTPNETIFIRVWEYDIEISNANFQISAYDTTVYATHLNFDGINDYVECGNILTPSYTKAAWIYLTDLSLSNNIISGGGDGTHAFWAPSIFGNLLSSGHAPNFNQVQDATPLSANTWYHVAVTYDATNQTMKLYKNGTLVDSNTSVPSYTGGNAVRIGAYDSSNLLQGSVEEVRIWNVVLSESDIMNTMNCELQATETNLIAYYKFNQGFDNADNSSIDTITDSSGNNNEGTLINFDLSNTSSNWSANPSSPITTGNICSITLSTVSFDSNNGFTIYPNPTKSNIIIAIEQLTQAKAEIFDINGRLLLAKKLELSENQIDLSNLPNGMYLVKISSKEGVATSKIVKQ